MEITQLNKDPEPGGVCSSLPLGQVSAAGLYISFLLGLTFQLSLTPLRPDPRPSTSLSPPSPGESRAPDSPRPSFPGLCYGVSRESDETNEMAALHPLCLLTQGRKLGAPGALGRRGPPLGPSAVPESLGKAWRPPVDCHNSSAPIHQGPPLRAWVTSVWRPGLGPPGAGWREWGAGGQGQAPTIPFWTANPGGPGIQQQSRDGRPGAQDRRAPAPSLPAVCGWTRLENRSRFSASDLGSSLLTFLNGRDLDTSAFQSEGQGQGLCPGLSVGLDSMDNTRTPSLTSYTTVHPLRIKEGGSRGDTCSGLLSIGVGRGAAVKGKTLTPAVRCQRRGDPKASPGATVTSGPCAERQA